MSARKKGERKTEFKSQKSVKEGTVMKKLRTVKEKDYGVMFDLVLPSELQEIDLKIESKKRIIDAVPSKDCGQVAKATQIYIDSLTATLQNLNSQMEELKKEKKKNLSLEKIGKITENLNKSLKEKENINAEISLLIEKNRKFSQKWLDAKEKLEEEFGKVLEQKEEQKTEIELKSIEKEMIKDSILQISSQLSMVKDLNLHYTQSIERINEDMQLSNSRFHEQSILTEHVQEVRSKLIGDMKEIEENERKSSEIEKKLKKVASFFARIDGDREAISELEEKINVALEIIPDFQKEQRDNKLSDALSQLAATVDKLKWKEKGNEKKDLIQVQYFSMVNQAKLKELEINMKSKLTELQAAQVSELQKRMQFDREISGEKLKYLEKQLDFYQTQCENLNAKAESALSDFSKKSKKSAFFKKSFEESSQILEELSKKHSALEKTSENLIAQIANLKKPSQKSLQSPEFSKFSQDKQTTKIFFQLETLKQEVFQKEGEIITNLRKKQKLDERYETVKQHLQKLNSKVKNIEAEILEKINNEIDSKDSQIQVLKEMLRGSQKDLELKQSKLSSFKSKLEESKSSRS